MEEPRTNMITYSAAYDSSSKTDTGGDLYLISSYEGVISEDFGTAPDGGLTDAFLGEGNTGRHTLQIRGGAGLANNTKYSMSIFVKRASNHSNERYCKLETAIYSTWTHAGSSAVFDLSNGTEVTSPSSNVTSGIETYPDGWFRIHFETTTGTVGGNTGFYLNMCSSSGDTSSTTLTSSQGLLLYGTQMEAGAFPTSYIPTNGSTATRGKDLAEIDGEDFTDFFNQTEGTINCAYWLGNDNVGTRICQISASNYSVLDIVSGSGSGAGGYGYVYTNGAAQANGGQSSTNANYLNKLHVVTLAYKENDIAGINRNTGVVTNDTSATLHGGYDQLNFYQRQGDGNQLNGHLQRVQYYPKRLPDNQLKNINNQ